VSSGATRRQEIVQRLGEGEWSFEGLRHALQVSVRTLEDDLRHVERSVRRSPRKLRVEPARCADCDFVFRRREPKHWHPPSRCPRCRSEQILEARLRLEG
jgi:predicted Zn-ribbon and HTH transcriptional regulator